MHFPNIICSPYDIDSRAFFNRIHTPALNQRSRHDLIVRRLKAIRMWNALYLWYGADAGTLHDIGSGVLVPAMDGETVRVWTERKNGVFDAYQDTSLQQPTWSRAGGPNGLPAISADGVNSGMVIDSDVRLRPGLTLCAFGKNMGAAGSGNCYIWGFAQGNVSTPSDLGIISAFGGNPRIFTFDGAGVPININTPSPSLGDKLISHVYNNANSAAYVTGLPDTLGSLGTATSGIGPQLALFRSVSGNQGKGMYTDIMYFRTSFIKFHHAALENALFS